MRILEIGCWVWVFSGVVAISSLVIGDEEIVLELFDDIFAETGSLPLSVCCCPMYAFWNPEIYNFDSGKIVNRDREKSDDNKIPQSYKPSLQ